MERSYIIFWNQVDPGRPAFNPTHGNYKHRVLVEGDSWFTIGGVPVWNLLYSLRWPASNIVVTMAKPGDTLRNMSDMCNEELRRALSQRFGYPWHAILLSAGGNDLIEYLESSHPNKALLIPWQQRGNVTKVEDYFYLDRFDKLLNDYIKRGYRMIAEWRDAKNSGCKGCPIIVHTYDWATPTNSPAEIGPISAGPWLYPAVVRERVPESDWIALSDFAVRRFGDAIVSLEAELPNFNVVDTRGTIVRADLGATGESNDWLNEIHPTKGGYDKLAQKLSAELAAHLP